MPTDRDKPGRKRGPTSIASRIIARVDPVSALQIAELRRLQRAKYTKPEETDTLGPSMVSFFKQSVARRQTKLVKIADCFAHLVPTPLAEHCAIESFSRGTLTVVVDSASHLFDMKSLLLAGLLEQLKLACKTAGLQKVNLKPGRWYEGEGGDRRLSF